MKTFRYLILAILAILAVVSCKKDELIEPASPASAVTDDGSLVFRVNSTDGSDTKASYAGNMDLAGDDGNTISVSMSVMDAIESSFASKPETKGVPVTNDNLAKLYTGKVGIKAIYNDASAYIVDDLYYMENPPTWSTGYSWVAGSDTNPHTYYWPKTGNLDFWAWAPENSFDTPTIEQNEGAWNMSFSYTLPTPTTDFKDAKAENDLIFSAVLGRDCTKAEDRIPVDYTFQHALSAIKFKVGSKAPGTITKISLIGVSTGGSSVYTPEVTGEDPVYFTWTLNGNTATYSQAFESALQKSATTGTYDATITQDADGTVFMMIPQALEDQQVSIEILYPGMKTANVFSGKLVNSTITEWLPGHTYIYTIGLDSEVTVDVEDEVSGRVKSDVVVSNTGTLDAYLRADIIANWFDSRGNIIKHVTPEELLEIGAFKDLCAEGSNWAQGSDGYYYYKFQVLPGRATKGKLFDTFTVKEDVVIPDGGHLEMTIAVQGISAEYLKDHLAPGDTMKFGWDTTKLDAGIEEE